MLSWWMTVVWAHAGDGTVFEAAADGVLVLEPDNGVLADLGTEAWIDPSDPEVGELAARGVFLDPWGGLIFRPRETTPSAFSAVLKVHSFTDETKSRTLAFRKLPPANMRPITPTIGLVASEETVVSLAGLDEGTVAPKLYVDDPRVTVTCDQWTCTVKATPAKGDKTPFSVEYRLRDADHAVGIGRLIVATERGAPPTAAQPVLTTTGTDGLTIAFGGEDWVEVLDAPAHGRLLRKSSTSFTYQPDPVTVGADADSFEFVRHGAWGTSPQGVVPLPAHTERQKDRKWSVPFHADPDGSMTLDLRAPGIAGWPVPDGRATVSCPDGCSATVVDHEARITLDAKQLPKATLSLTLTYGDTVRRLDLDVSDVQADQGWCSAKLVPTNPERQDHRTKRASLPFILCAETAGDKDRILVRHLLMTATGEARAKNGKWISIGERDRSYGTMRPPADRPIYLLVRSGPDTEPELTVTMDDTEKVGTLVWRHTLLRDPTSSDHSDSPEPRILSLYRFDRDGAVDLAVVKVKTDRGSRELSYASRMPLWKWSSEHALFPTVSADALLVPAGVRLVTDAGVEGSATTPDLLTRANLLDSDFYLIRLGLRTAVGVSGSTTEGDSEPAPEVFASLPLGLDRESTFRVFTAGTGAWATFPIVADDLRRGGDGAERSYNLSLGGRLGIEPTREDDQVPFVEGSLEGRAVLTSIHSKDDLKLVATGKVAVARASTELQNQLELGHHWFTWAFVGGSMGVGDGPSLGIRLVVDPYDDDKPVMPTVVVELGR